MASPQLQGQAQAQKQFNDNIRRAFQGSLVGIESIARDAYSRPQAWVRYDRAYAKLLSLAQSCALMGDTVSIPARLAETAPSKMISISAPVVDTSYRETRGLGPSGMGMPAKVNLDWLSDQADKTLKVGAHAPKPAKK
jgi:hypothetical protein